MQRANAGGAGQQRRIRLQSLELLAILPAGMGQGSEGARGRPPEAPAGGNGGADILGLNGGWLLTRSPGDPDSPVLGIASSLGVRVCYVYALVALLKLVA